MGWGVTQGPMMADTQPEALTPSVPAGLKINPHMHTPSRLQVWDHFSCNNPNAGTWIDPHAQPSDQLIQ